MVVTSPSSTGAVAGLPTAACVEEPCVEIEAYRISRTSQLGHFCLLIQRGRAGDGAQPSIFMRLAAVRRIAMSPKVLWDVVRAAAVRAGIELAPHDLRRVNAEIYRQGASAMARSFKASELPMPPEQLVKVLHALTDGLTFLRFLTPELITDDVVIAAFEALA